MRQISPRWSESRRRWRTQIKGHTYHAPKEIGENDLAGAWVWLKSLLSGQPPNEARGGPTLNALIAARITHAEKQRAASEISRNALNRERSILRRLAADSELGDRPASGVTTADIQAFLDGAIYSNNHKLNIITRLSAAYNWAIKEKMVTVNPVRGISRPKTTHAKHDVNNSPIRPLLRRAWATSRFSTPGRRSDARSAIHLLRFMSITGCRAIEACRLTWPDIDFEQRMATFAPDRHKTGVKTGKPRVIYLTSRAIRLLRAAQSNARPGREHVFSHYKGPWNTQAIDIKLRGWRNKLAPEANVTPYAARHAYCSEALAGGASYELVGKLVGNSPEVLRKHYEHPIHKQLLADAELIDKIRREVNRRKKS